MLRQMLSTNGTFNEMLKLWENTMISIEDRLAAAYGEIDRLIDDNNLLRKVAEEDQGEINQLRGDIERLNGQIASLHYAYELNESLIGKIQEVVHIIASRPVIGKLGDV